MTEPVDIWEATRTIIKLRNQAPALNAADNAETSFPLSLSQERLFALDALHPEEALYNLPYAFHLKGTLDKTRLAQSLAVVLERQAVLRTHFEVIDGQVRQCIDTPQTVELKPIDVSELSFQQAKQQIISELRQSLHLQQQSAAFRYGLYRLTNNEHVLGVTFHHIISDYWSENQFFKELSEAYNQRETDKSAKPLTIAYADFSRWQRQWFCQEGVLDFLLNYWHPQLQGLAQPDLPLEHSLRDERQVAFETITVSAEQVTAFKTLARQHKVQLFSVLLSAFKQVLAEHLNTTDIGVFSPISNRNRAELQQLMGDFSNPLILRTDLSGNPTQSELLKRVGQVVSGAVAHQDLPLQLIKASIPLKLPQASFSYLNIPQKKVDLDGLDIDAWDLGLGTIDFDLFLLLKEQKGALTGYLKYDTRLFSQATIQRLIEKFNRLLEMMVAHPEQHLDLSAQVLSPEKTKKAALLPIPELIKQIQQPLEDANQHSKLWQQLQALSSAERVVQLKQIIKTEVQSISGVLPTDEQGFFDLGLDSLTSIQLSNRLSLALTTFLAPTLTLEHPSVTRLAEHLNTTLFETEREITKKDTTQSTKNEPIAIVGMGCRFPGGAHSLEQFWELLHEGQETVTDIPASRWSIDAYYDPEAGSPGKMYMQQASFLQHPIEDFDAPFFGMSPLEARQLDPKQRLLLEVTWEALENAGIATDDLPIQTGVFVGLMESEIGLKTGADDVYATTGTLTAMSTGRLSYLLGVQGPNLSLDTACSSSLVALHLACQSLRAGECELAVTGGVNVMLSPELMVGLSGMTALSPDGRCKTFDESADGFGRGEGCGIVVLKRLSDAVAAGDHIWATVQGSAVNHDGASSGLTVPNKVAQTALIRQALQRAEVSGNEVSYVEAHGTGTKLGDPIEVRALADALGERETPLTIGSVKTNLGHLDASAGIAGLIKVALSLHHKIIPPHLHFKRANPLMDWDNLPFQIPLEATPWQSNNKPRIAGISGFGMGGTNAHAILQQAPSQTLSKDADTDTKKRPAHLLLLSARTEAALTDQIAQYAAYCATHPETSLADMCYTTSTGRTHYAHRATIMAQDIAELTEKLRSAEVDQHPKPVAEIPQVAFLFTGQGSQYWGMGRELFETQPLFRDILQQCHNILKTNTGMSLLDLLYAQQEEEAGQLSHTKYTQPALFSLEYALAKLWQSWGITPTALIGHSVGEYVAACIAGVFSLEDGLTLIAERGRLMQALPANGTMVAIQCTEDTIQPILADYSQQVAIAGFNAPQSLVLSGENTAIEAIITALEQQQIKCHPLQVSHAFHSALMEPMLAEFAEVARTISYTAPDPQFNLISNVTGAPITQVDADYWINHIRQPVRFAQGMEALATLGINTFIEIGARPTLVGLGQQCISGSADTLWLPSLYPNQYSDWQQLLTSLGKLYVCGGQVDWQALDAPYARRKITLPTYPFQRQRHWIDKPAVSFNPQAHTGHPLLGERLPTIANNDTVVFQQQLSADSPPYLKDHQVYGQVITPATAYLEMALTAAQQVLGNIDYCLQNIVLLQPLVLSTSETSQVQLQLTPSNLGYQWKVFSLKPQSENEWELHIEGELTTTPLSAPPTDKDDTLASVQHRCAEEMSLTDYHNAVSDDLYYGDHFQALQQLFTGDKEALGLIELATALDANAYHLHPVLLDCCLRVVQAIRFEDNNAPYLPFSFDALQLFSNTPLNRVWSFVKWRTDVAGTRVVDVTLFAPDGSKVATVTGFGLRQANRQAMTGSALRLDYLYELAWHDAPLAKTSPYTITTGHWLIVADAQQPQANALALLLSAEGETVEFSQTAPQQSLSDYRAVVYFATPSTAQQAMPDTVLDISCQALHFVQQLIQAQATLDLHFVINDSMEESGLWGLGRTLMWEQPNLNCKCLEINANTSTDTLFNALWFADNENQLKLTTDNARQIARLDPLEAQQEQQSRAVKVQLETYGLLESLQLVPLQRQAPAAQQVEVQVRASGLNFRDVLNALGMLKSYYDPELGFNDPKKLPFGFEAAGIVSRIGTNVTDFQVGDDVMVWQHFGSLATFITVDTPLITAKPKHLSFEQAATIPIVFLTAYYALIKLAKMKAGDKVLIHAAAGGVGQAAVQIAQHIGAEVFATASQPKWDFLASQGIQHIMNSRTLEFAAQIQTLTDGQGVDIVLNSLNGDYIERNFDSLAQNGRFVELGKIDIWDQQQAEHYRQDVGYACFDWSDMPKAMQLREQVESLFVQQQLTPLPAKIFPINAADDAFQFMANAQQIGKVVLSISEQATHEIRIETNQSYLITGGLGGLGFKTAQWLAKQGASHLVLSGRSQPAKSIQTAINALEVNGVQVKVITADISNVAAVQALVEASDRFAPLKGIIHSAGVLDDGIIDQQTPARFAKTFAPKVQGSWSLHQACQHLSLDFFVCFSSQTALLGNGGQANYAAANAFMDSLMQHRQRQGQAGLSINWGAWSEIGMAKDLVANDKEVITPKMGVELFGVLLQQATAQAGVFPYRWENFAKKLPSLTGFPVLSRLVKPTSKEQTTQSSLRQKITQAEPNVRLELIKDYLKTSIEPIVGRIPKEDDGFFVALDMDSLKSIQLTNRLGADLEVSVSVTTILEHSSILLLADILLEKLGLATSLEEATITDDYEEGEL